MNPFQFKPFKEQSFYDDSIYDQIFKNVTPSWNENLLYLAPAPVSTNERGYP